jgi:hypothetical protein
MSLERDSDLKRRFRIGDSRHRCKEKQQRSKGLESRRWRNTTWVVKRECSNKWDRDMVLIHFTLSPRPVVLCAAPVYVCCWKGLVELCVWCLAEHCHPLLAHCYMSRCATGAPFMYPTSNHLQNWLLPSGTTWSHNVTRQPWSDATSGCSRTTVSSTSYLETCIDIFKRLKKSSKTKLVDLFCHDSVKRDLRALVLSLVSSF